MVYVDHIRPLTETPDFSEYKSAGQTEAEKAAEQKPAASKPKQKARPKPKKKGA